ncbi:MAG: zf-HC2 domain-containing protein [Acidimicrobiia bacterium]
MDTCDWWEDVSASLDDENSRRSRSDVDAHLATCDECDAMANTPALASNPFEAAPLPLPADRLDPAEDHWLRGVWSRRALMVVAMVFVAEGAPAFLGGTDAEAHAARHLATWQIGFGAGLLVAGWMSRLSQAMLALAFTVTGLTVLTAVIDVVTGHQGPLGELIHLVEVVAVFLLWRTTPPHLRPWRSGREDQ